MAREKNVPGKLIEELLVPITTQEQAYRILAQVPEINIDTTEALLMAIAKGSELYWVRTALKQDRFPSGAPSRRAALTRLAESSFDAMKQVLEQDDGRLYRNKIASRFATTYDGSMVALRLDANWTQTQTIRFISVVLPHIGEKEAIGLLARSCVRNLPVEHRSQVVVKVRSWPDYPIDRLFTGSKNYPDPEPPWSDKEREILIGVIAKSTDAAHNILFPHSHEKLHGLAYNEDPGKEKVSRKEKRQLAESAGRHILLKLRTQANTDHYKNEAAELLAAFEANLSQELKDELKKRL